MPPEKYEGPFDSLEEEDAALKKQKRLRERLRTEEADAEAARAEEAKKKKKKGDLPVVD